MVRRREAESRLRLAHELRTPLTSLGLGVGLLHDGSLGPLSKAQRDVVAQLAKDVERLGQLVDQSLRTDGLGFFAGSVTRRRLELGDLARAAAEPIEPQARERGVAIAWSVTPAVVVNADPKKLGWVAASVLGNALRFSPRGSTIGVAVIQTDGKAELRVQDAGPGMPPKQLARVLDESGGRGLMLPLAKEIVVAHGGAITVSSGVGRGTCIVVQLPLAPREI